MSTMLLLCVLILKTDWVEVLNNGFDDFEVSYS